MMKPMESSILPGKKILLDGDVISHFIKGGLFNILNILYKGRLIILDIVRAEIAQRKGWDTIIEELINMYSIQEITFPQESKYTLEYAHLISHRGLGLGKGESACMVYCRFNDDILASSNLKDISRYCKLHNIGYITTADIIYEAYVANIISESDGDAFIANLHAKSSRFPYSSMRELINARPQL